MTEKQDPVIDLLLGEARLQMMRLYKPGVVEETGEPVVTFKISKGDPIRSITGPYGDQHFYGLYKIYIPLQPTIPVKDQSDLLRSTVQTKVHFSKGDAKITDAESTLVIYAVDFWVTKEGEVWREVAEGIWSHELLKLPFGLLQGHILHWIQKMTEKDQYYRI